MAIPNAPDWEAARRRCRDYRRRILAISQKVSALHVAPAFSCLEIVDDNDEVWDPSDRVPDSELAALHRDACIGAHLGNR